MQWVREQEHARNQPGIVRHHHRGLATSIGLAPDVYLTRHQFLDRLHRIAQSLAIAGSIAGAWRTKRPRLSIGQVTAQDGESGSGKGLRQGYQEWRLAV